MKAPQQQKCRAFGRPNGPRRQLRCRAAAQAPAKAQDAFVAQALSAAGISNSVPESLYQRRMPTRKLESYRYTDLSPLQQQRLQAPPALDAAAVTQAAQRCQLEVCETARLVIVDGQVCAKASDVSGLPDGVFAGNGGAAPAGAAQHAGLQARGRDSVFTELNAATARGRVVVHVPQGVHCSQPLHIVYASSSARDAQCAAASAPQLLIVCEAGASLEVIEECTHCGTEAAGTYFVNAVAEAVLHQGAALRHRFLECDARSAFHVRSTLVNQQQGSTYSLVEARLGGSLTRHDVSIKQLGTGTTTEMKHFVLCGDSQLHDLHTSLVLDHEEGAAQQLHKCIVAAGTGHGVFDGNVQVNAGAQRTDAGQLSRNLLLVPRATVNVKPNLQIIADDVACTHGCAVSDLSASELFYFRSRGIDAAEARRALVFSFGAEVLQALAHKQLVERMQAAVAATLRSVV